MIMIRHILCFGKPDKATYCIEIPDKPNAIRRFFLRTLLGLYYEAKEVK